MSTPPSPPPGSFRKASRPAMAAVREPATDKADPRAVERLVELVAQLGEYCLALIGEVQDSNQLSQATNRTAKFSGAVSTLVAAGLVAGAVVNYQAAKQLEQQRKQDVQSVTTQIDLATARLETAVRHAETAADEAAKAAQRATAESLEAQAEAAEVRARLSPPRERKEIAEAVEERRSEAAKLRQ